MGSRSAAAAASAVLLAGAISGCGGSSAATHTATVAPRAVSGRQVFAQHCAICHSISGRLYRTQQGGELQGLHLPRRELVQFTVEMPVIKRPLTGREVQAVVDFVQSMSRSRGGR